ncbi:MAG: hypothetical protein ACI4KM_03525 [Oscillospiraceae bacterium]
MTIKTGFMSGEVSQPQYSEPHYYRGLYAADLGVEVNPRLWFKGFRFNIDITNTGIFQYQPAKLSIL